MYTDTYQMSDLLPESSVQPEVFAYCDSDALDGLPTKEEKIKKIKQLEQ